MTVSSIIPVNTYSGNNSSTKFDFDFLIENEDELMVTHINKYGESSALKNGIDYKINKIGSITGSYIIFPLESSEYKVLAENEKIVLELTLPIKQESKFENSGSMAWDAVEWSFDYIVRILQIISRKIAKAVKIPEGNDKTGDDILNTLDKIQSDSKKYAQMAEEKAAEAQETLKKTEIQAENAKNYTDKVKDALNIIKPAEENSLGMIMPDNKTTFVNKNGILSVSKYNMFDIIEKDYILSYEDKEGLELLGEYIYKKAQDGRYGYPDFYNKCLEEYKVGVDNEEEIEGVIIKVNSNGHKFYNIADKDKIDDLYKETGFAWYYGVDEEEERILLPRKQERILVKSIMPKENNKNWYSLYSDGWLEQGGYIETNQATTKFTVNFLFAFKDTNYYFNQSQYSSSDDYYQYVTNKKISSIDVTGQNGSNGFDWIAKGYINEQLKINRNLYMVVGNVSVPRAKIEVSEITTSENDTIPLGLSMYAYDPLEINIGWVKSLGSWLSGKVYTSFYNKAVNKIGQKFAGGNIKDSKEKYSNCDLVINQDEMTFRLPISAGGNDEKGELYFKLGNAVENLEYINAGEVSDILNNIGAMKMQECSVVMEKYNNGDSWYRLWSDGWIEQGGKINRSSTGGNPITLLKTYKDKNYCVTMTYDAVDGYVTDSSSYYVPYIINKTKNSLNICSNASTAQVGFIEWKTEGYIEDEYI